MNRAEKLFHVSMNILVAGSGWLTVSRTCEASSIREATNIMRKHYYHCGAVDPHGQQITPKQIAIVRPYVVKRIRDAEEFRRHRGDADSWDIETDSILFVDLPPAQEVMRRLIEARKLRKTLVCSK